MAISHLYPTQRPSLDLNFARQKRLDSRVTFTRGSTATYVGSDGLIKTAAANEARFDHDPVTGESLGLLVEEARTNLSAYGEKLNGGTWTTPWYTVYKVTKTYNAATAPNGLTSATLVVPNTELQQHYISSEETAVTSAVYTMSIYAKYSGYNFRMDFKGPNRGASFYLNTGTIGAVSSGITASMQALPGGWYRCSITYNTATTDIDSFIKILNLSNSDFYQGDNTSGVYFWGYQIEAGTFATSIIPTSGSTVTRSADVASMTGTNFSSWYNQSEGTLLTTADYNGTNSSNYNMIVEGYSGASFRDFSCLVAASNPDFVTRYSFTSLDLVPVGGPIPTKTAFKLVGSYSASGSAAVFNGGAVKTTGTAVAVLTPADAMSIGCRVGSTLFLNGHISRLAYYPTRLSDTQLQALTL